MRATPFFLTIFSVLTAATQFGRHVVHENRAALKSGWHKTSKMDPQSILPIRIALVQQNLHEAEHLLISVSDPDSPQYSKYWTPGAVAQKFSPSKTTINQVTNWLNQSGIAHNRLRRSNSGTELLFDATVHEAEQLLHTTYHVYESKDGAHGGCEDYSIPTDIRKHIDFITPTVHLDLKLRHRGLKYSSTGGESHNKRDLNHTRRDSSPPFRANATTTCDQLVTPECLRALYHIPMSNSSHPDNSFGVVEFGWVTYLPDDLDLFFQEFEPTMVGNRPIYDSIDGGKMQTVANFSTFNDEADLDVEYAMSLTHPLNVTNYQVGDLLVMAGMNNFLAAIDKTYCGSLDPAFDPIYPDPAPAHPPFPGGYNSSDCGNHHATKVISISYAHDEISFTPAYEQRQCLEYLKLGLQGITVIFSSADFGTAGLSGTCLDPNDGFNSSTSNNGQGSFNPTFPSTCPYITSVGGTQLPTKSSPSAQSSVLDAEVAFETFITGTLQNGTTSSNQLSSGGGFSNVFPLPSYQSRLVENYLQGEESYLFNITTKFNAFGRGYPDVSTNAANHVTAVDGEFRKIYGTSASAPVFGSIVAMINDARLKAGKKSVGFINPALYTHPHVLNDVVDGMNYGCAGTDAFRAVKGWDPVTGLGTPDFDRMLDLFLRLP